MASFFDPSLTATAGEAFVDQSKVDDTLRKLIPAAHITKGSYRYPSRSELRDLVWNHMDQSHRPLIHRTYGVAARIHIGGSTSFSLTRFGHWPFVIPVFDGYFKENGFYQVMVLFGLIAVVIIIECNPNGNESQMDVSWTIASHRWLRFLHPLLSRRLVRLNHLQNREDDPIRDRRVALRAAGYRFKTDLPDFVNSNVKGNSTIFPPLQDPVSISLADLPDGRAVQIEVANRSYILRRQKDAVEIWPSVCPHEGAEIRPEHLSGSIVRCPWHGLEFAARRLVPDGGIVEICGARLELSGDMIVLAPGTAAVSV
ncbi:MAG: Rieske 2Fe-2S domain-containing protein [Enhydrobacter sp.]|nr:MAG: Rieske 2Fe-2S domain-containing protein [Enhydrobacter sp.]